MSRANPLIEPAGRTLTGHNDLISTPIREHAFFGVETQVSLAAVFLRAVAGKAVVRENGANVAVEVHGLFGRAWRRLPGGKGRKTKRYSNGW